jgi:hypothetical protein
MKDIKCWLFFILSCLSFETLAQSIFTPKYSNEFLNIGVSAKNLGMGNTGVSIVNDVTSGYWNPAGLTQISHKQEISLMHNEYFGGVAQYNYLSASIPTDSSSRLAISYIRLSIDNIPDTRFLFDNSGNGNSNTFGPIDYSKIKFFSSADNAFLVSFAKQNKKFGGSKMMGMYRYGVRTYLIDSSGNNLSFGGSFKLIHRKVGSFADAWGFGFDLGTQMKYRKWFLGACVKDITSTFNFWNIKSDMLKSAYATSNTIDSSKQNTLPSNTLEITLPKLSVGAARYIQLNKSKTLGILPNVDFDITFDGKRNVLIRTNLVSIDPKIGVELNYKKKLFVRTGINNFQKLKDFDGSHYYTVQPTVGIGVQFTRLVLDYALVNPANASVGLYSHVFSIKLGLNDLKK